jgi:hypothetical protein
MKKFVKHGILNLVLVTAMGWLGSNAEAVTLQAALVEEVTLAEINNLATRYCQGLNSAADQIECIQRLNQCVLGAGNRFGCEVQEPNGEVYQCESSQGIQFTMETMVELCHENPNPAYKFDASQFVVGRGPLAVIPSPSQGGNRVGAVDPDLLQDEARRLRDPLQVVDDNINRNTPDSGDERQDVVAAAPGAEEIIDADSAATGEISGSGFGCSLGAGTSNAEAYWMIGLLAAAPLAWPRRRRKANSPTQGQ